MQRLFRCGLVLASLLLTTNVSHAGVYDLEELPLWPIPENYKLILSLLRTCPDPPPAPPGVKAVPPEPTSLRARYLKQFEVLDARRKTNSLLGTRDYVNLSGCMIRLHRITGNDGAIEFVQEFLKEMPEDDPARFLIYANLAMAYHLGGEPRRPADYQAMALEAWPEIWAGWQPLQLGILSPL